MATVCTHAAAPSTWWGLPQCCQGGRGTWGNAGEYRATCPPILEPASICPGPSGGWRAAALGLAEYQLAIYDNLVRQVDQGAKIPRDVLPILAHYLDKIDLTSLLMGAQEAAETLGISLRGLPNTIARHPHWMRPIVEPVRSDGVTPIIQLWLRARVNAYAAWRSTEGTRARLLGPDEDMNA